VEEGVVVKIEEAIQDVKGVKTIRSTAMEGVGTVTVELTNDTDLDEALNDIKIKVDSIATFPAETERPVISKFEFSAELMWLSVFGDMDRRTRQTIAQQVRDEIMTLPEVNKAEVLGNRPYEITVEVTDADLRQYGLSMSDISRAIRQYSVDLPGGSIKTEGGDIRLRTKGQAYTGLEFAEIVLRTNADGTRLLLSDVAKINDGFVESDGYARFNGKPASVIRIKSVGEQNDLEIAKAVRDYVNKKNLTLPPGAQIEIWGDGSYYLQQRLDMMFDNMWMGILLVFVLLTLFLRPKIALWVLVGIPISFLGAFLLMDKLGPVATNINFLSLFGLILVLGIVVDDAIIIGESVYTEIKKHGHSVDNVITGAQRVAVPATFGVLTTVAAFVPMLTLDTVVAPFFEAIAVVVILCLLFSLAESKWILPAHLAHMKYTPYDESKATGFAKVQHAIRQAMEDFATNKYYPVLKKAVNHRYLTMLLFLSMLTVSCSVVQSGWVKQEIFPSIPAEMIRANFTLNEGSPITARDNLIHRMEQAAREVNEKLTEQNDGQPIMQHLLAWTNSDTSGGMLVELTRGETRKVDSWQFERAWREAVGEVAGVKELRFMASAGIGGDAGLSFRLVGPNYETLERAAKELQDKLAEYDGVYDIRNSDSAGSKEIMLSLKPGAETLGITLYDLGLQVRQAFYGEEAQRIQRGKDEIRVMVRYPRDNRESLTNLENMRIRTPSGAWVPFTAVADYQFVDGFSTIQREDRKRAISVKADINPDKIESQKVIVEIYTTFMPKLMAKYPGVQSELSGQSKENQDFMMELRLSFLFALGAIYVLLAIPLKSYVQPLMVMIVIPFGFIGALIGHLMFGQSISMMSYFGLVALSGVVVNDSLLMVEFVNRAREEGLRIVDAILLAGVQRFRAIMLTSLTTFLGLFPIMFETSLQAQVIIPMAISLAFGILFATIITLFLIPAMYMILEDLRGRSRRKPTGDELALNRELETPLG
jgi:multidrug efflux pump subunit AcrB